MAFIDILQQRFVFFNAGDTMAVEQAVLYMVDDLLESAACELRVRFSWEEMQGQVVYTVDGGDIHPQYFKIAGFSAAILAEILSLKLQVAMRGKAFVKPAVAYGGNLGTGDWQLTFTRKECPHGCHN